MKLPSESETWTPTGYYASGGSPEVFVIGCCYLKEELLVVFETRPTDEQLKTGYVESLCVLPMNEFLANYRFSA